MTARPLLSGLVLTAASVTTLTAAPAAQAVTIPGPATTAPTAGAPAAASNSWRVPDESTQTSPDAVLSTALRSRPDLVRVTFTRIEDGVPVVHTRTVPTKKAKETVAAAQADDQVVAVAADQKVTHAGYSDPYLSDKWDVTLLQGSSFAAKAKASAATVAVIDTGVQANHPDLSGTVLSGAQFVDTTGVSSGTGQRDVDGHGTHVSGIIAESANSTGAVGLLPGARILPVRVFNDAGEAWTSDVARGLTWAADHGAAVANLSLGGGQDPNVTKAVQYALAKNVVVVAAAGNEKTEGNAPSYPGADAGVIAVGATDKSDVIAPFSNTGSYVDLSAPGVSILSTYPTAKANPAYAYMSGTSMASPEVAAAAAGLKSVAASLTPTQVQSYLTRTATDLGAAGRDDVYGAGRINPLSAINAVIADRTGRLRWSLSSTRPTYGTAVTAKAILTTASGRAVPNAAVKICTTPYAVSTSCITKTTSSTGEVYGNFTARSITSLSASYAGSSSLTAASASTKVNTTRKLTASVGSKRVTATVTPTGATVRLWKLVSGTWTQVRSGYTSSTGTVTFSSLTTGYYSTSIEADSRFARVSTPRAYVS